LQVAQLSRGVGQVS